MNFLEMVICAVISVIVLCLLGIAIIPNIEKSKDKVNSIQSTYQKQLEEYELLF